MNRIFGFCEGDSPFLQWAGKWAYIIYHEREMIEVFSHILIAAMFPIYIGAHASLHRPLSAKPAKRSNSQDEEEEEEEKEETEVVTKLEGFQPSDAILLPMIAAITLAGLYLIIKWLDDPSIVNRILGYYFSFIGVFVVGALMSDALKVGTSFIFPTVWKDGEETYFIDPRVSRQVTKRTWKTKPQSKGKVRFFDDKTNPFPGYLSNIKFSKHITNRIWSFRALLRDRWTFKGYIYGISEMQSQITPNDALGYLIGVAIVIFYNLNGRTWWLTNIMGFGFCYAALQMMTPTKFLTGSLVLAGLFVYDIIMVFYTPMMVTVATTVNVPIKLVFPGPTRDSMLGLGDVILPGIMIALALRFDLYLHYLSLQKTIPPVSPSFSPLTSPPTPKAPMPARTEKAEYVDASGKWGERFWTRKGNRSTIFEHLENNPANNEQLTTADGARFEKVYFNAGMVGYLIGMIMTLAVMTIWKHAQPALLYLVPAVLSALWGTAWVKGDVKLMSGYSEEEILYDDDLNTVEEDKTKAGAKDVKANLISEQNNAETGKEQSGAEIEDVIENPNTLGVEGMEYGQTQDERIENKEHGENTQTNFDSISRVEKRRRDGESSQNDGYVFSFSLAAPKSWSKPAQKRKTGISPTSS